MSRNALTHFVLTLALTATTAIAQKLYWTEPPDNEIRAASLNGTNVQTVLSTDPASPQFITIDPAAGKMYWTQLDGGGIARADLDGGNVEMLVSGDAPSGIALDPVGNAMYWTDSSGTVKRAALDGSNVETLVTDAGALTGIALDLTGGKMYWANQGVTTTAIRRANLDGTDVEEMVIPGFTTPQIIAPFEIAIDASAGKMYWTDPGKQAILRVNLEIPDGSFPQFRQDLETLIPGLFSPAGLSLELTSGKIYWTVFGMIQRADLDGSNVEAFSDPGIASPLGLAIAPCTTDADCDDQLFCTGTETCDIATGLCQSGVSPCVDQVCDEGAQDCVDCIDGMSCDDGDFCTIDDTCVGLNCVGTPADPAVLCDDGDPCTLDTCDSSGCSHQINPGAPCDDGDACTENDSCDDSGACTVSTAVVCDDSDLCTTDTCDSVTGCAFIPINVPVACNDFDVCTADTCDPQLGCQHAVDDCDDGDACTTDTCDPVDGCANTPINCDDSDACTTDSCDSAIGCINEPFGPSDCDDGIICTADSCDSEQGCIHVFDAAAQCDDSNPCTFDSCTVADGCINTPSAGATCDDGDACTSDDVCSTGGICVGTLADCDDDNPCTTDVCDPIDGCQNTPNEGMSCDDGNTCTTDDVCDAAGVCSGVVSGAAGDSCDDGDACTENDVCDAEGGCAGTVVDCNDNNPCTADSCDPAAGCINANDDSLDCPDDAFFCNGEETCVAGVCTSMGDPCVAVCDEDTDSCGCSTAADCDDGDLCTTDVCGANGICSNSSMTCNDGILCTSDSCDSNTGCVFTPVDAACDDGLFCNGEEICNAVSGCLSVAEPCPNQSCDEATESCVGPEIPSGSAGEIADVGVLGSVVAEVSTPDGRASASVEVTTGTTGEEVTLALIQNSGAPGVDGINTFAGFEDENALGVTLRVTTSMPDGTFVAIVQFTVPQSDLSDLGLGTIDAAIHVLDEESDSPVWTLAGDRFIGLSDPTEVPGDYGFFVSDADITYWTVREAFSAFAIGQTQQTTAPPAAGDEPPPSQDTPDAPVDPTPGGDAPPDMTTTPDVPTDGGDAPTTEEPPAQPTPDDSAPACGAAPCGTLGLGILPLLMVGLGSMRRRFRSVR